MNTQEPPKEQQPVVKPKPPRKQRAPKSQTVVGVNERLDVLQNPTVNVQLTPDGSRVAVSTGVKSVQVQGFVRGQRSPVTGRNVKFTKTYKQPPPPKPPETPIKLHPTQFQVRGIEHPPAGLPVIKKSILASSPVKGIQ
jgi:hypothetical protein